LEGLPPDIQNKIQQAVSRLLVRACHEALRKREFLVKQIKRVPEDAKWDHVNNPDNGRFVRIGKCSSAALRSEFLDKL